MVWMPWALDLGSPTLGAHGGWGLMNPRQARFLPSTRWAHPRPCSAHKLNTLPSTRCHPRPCSAHTEGGILTYFGSPPSQTLVSLWPLPGQGKEAWKTPQSECGHSPNSGDCVERNEIVQAAIPGSCPTVLYRELMPPGDLLSCGMLVTRFPWLGSKADQPHTQLLLIEKRIKVKSCPGILNLCCCGPWDPWNCGVSCDPFSKKSFCSLFSASQSSPCLSKDLRTMCIH